MGPSRSSVNLNEATLSFTNHAPRTFSSMEVLLKGTQCDTEGDHPVPEDDQMRTPGTLWALSI